MKNTIVMEKQEDGSYAASFEGLADPAAEAKLEQAAILGGIDKFTIAGVNVGAGLIGGSVALLTTEVVGGLVPATGFTASLVKLLAAGALVRFGSGILGKTATTYASAFIAFDVARGLIPIDSWIADITGRFGGAQMKQARTPGPNVQEQANQVASDYYAQAFGR